MQAASAFELAAERPQPLAHIIGLPQDLEKTLEPLLFYYKAARRADEGFGDFCGRVGFPALESYAASYISPTASESLPKVKAR